MFEREAREFFFISLKYKVSLPCNVEYYEILNSDTNARTQVLLMVGQRLERPDVIDSLLDAELVKKGKPNYSLAPAYPLLFYYCEFEGLKWRRSSTASRHIRKILEEQYCRAAVELAKIQTQIEFLGEPENDYEKLFVKSQTSEFTHDFGERFGSVKAKHRKLLDRDREKTYEERVGSLSGKSFKRYKINKEKRDAYGRTT